MHGMHPKHLLPLLAAASVCLSSVAANSITARRNLRGSETERKLQASLGCLVAGDNFTDCCPAADSDDGICTLGWCINVESMTLRDTCGCDQIEDACGALRFVLFLADGAREMCKQTRKCCRNGKADNEKFEECMINALEEGDIEIPRLPPIPGGLPKFPEDEEEDETTTKAPSYPGGGPPRSP